MATEPIDFRPSAKVIADSISSRGDRLTTIEVRMHRYVLAEFNTHRALSRNSASSRAIPVAKTIARLTDEPVYPAVWRSEQRGMQGGAELDDIDLRILRQTWDSARDAAIRHADSLAYYGVHKSIVNRLLEPFMSHTVLVTASDWDNFWRQRCSPLAQDEIRLAAEAMRDAYLKSQPREVRIGRWHLPYISDDEREEHGVPTLRKVSAARCARVSYLTHDGQRSIEADLDLFNRLIQADPPHASPLEHVATPVLGDSYDQPGNFSGWLQLRHTDFVN